MYARILSYPKDRSFFLFGPRSTGKSTWVHQEFPSALFIDLLKASAFTRLTARPDRLEGMIPDGFSDWVIVDAIQKIPALLYEVHRLIERRKLRFILTGSSPRKLRRGGVNLLGGRALTLRMYPLTAAELKDDFDVKRALVHGLIPLAYMAEDPRDFLESYIQVYLQEEIAQEGLIRDIGSFTRFLESASFSQGSVLNVSTVARDCAVPRKTVEGYFDILHDLQVGYRIPLFQKRARRKIQAHPIFYFFDAGLFRALRPLGPLEDEGGITGPALETLVLQELLAISSYLRKRVQIHYWRSVNKMEVDFIVYGEKTFLAIEVTKSGRVREDDTAGLKAFLQEYPQANAYLLYGGSERHYEDKIHFIPAADFFRNAVDLLR
ncbi:MAG: ATP-binding protein [Deltaproteobacteria bacterium]|nr:ATP-binding protein [Deltaproteobacteria bacterium]